MPLAGLALALLAAVVHASWNLLIAGESDKQTASAVAIAIGVLAFAPAALTDGHLDSEVVPLVAASAALEVLYLALLAAAYSRADIGFVYPTARGGAPVLVLVGGGLLLGTGVTAAGALGVGMVAGGIVLIRGARRPGRGSELLLAAAVAGCVAAYTLVDKEALANASPLTYLEAVFAIVAVSYLVAILGWRGPTAVMAAANRRVALAGIGMVGAYGLALAALSTSSAAAVAAVRESSVLIVVGVVAARGQERVSVGRWLGAAAVFAGVATIAIS